MATTSIHLRHWNGSFLPAAILTIWAAGLLLVAPETPAQDGDPSPPAAGEPAARLEELEERLATARARLEGLAPPSVEGAAGAQLTTEIELLERLRSTLESQQEAQARSRELAAKRQDLDLELTSAPSEIAGHPPPYTVAELDQILDQADAVARSHASLQSSIEVEEAGLEAAQERSLEAEQRRREARDALETAAADEAAPRRATLGLRELEAEIARQEIRLLELELANDRLDLELRDERRELLRQTVAWVRQRTQLSPDDARRRDQEMRGEEEELERRAERARLEVEQASADWSRMRQEVASAESSDPVLDARAAASRAALELAQQRLEVLEDRRRWVELQRQAWELRAALLRGELTQHAELEETKSKLDDITAELEREVRGRQSLLEQVRARRVGIAAELDAAPQDGPLRRAIELRNDQVDALAGLYREDLERLRSTLTRVERPRAEVASRVAKVSLRERLASAWKQIIGVWDFELWVVEDESITVGKVVVALVLVFAGAALSRRLSRLLAHRVLQRFGLTEGVAAAVQTLTFYLLAVVFVLWALHLVNIPLTVFTFLGGALAIGVGFGSQNIVNNFMSGLILMVERPVKVGDLIDLDGTYGRVEAIGTRSTRIRSGDNTHIIVPNSHLLENRVLNWTLSDNLVRSHADVGVAYGSDTKEVRRRLEQALAVTERILEKPAPEVFFADFGNNALIFRVLFWTHVHAPLDRTRAASRLRFHIDELFREAGITIAFPQRDVHLDVQGPVEVRLQKTE